MPVTITLRGSEVVHARVAGRRRWMAWSFRRASRIIAVSESLRQFAISLGGDPDRVARSPMALIPRSFTPVRYGKPGPASGCRRTVRLYSPSDI